MKRKPLPPLNPAYAETPLPELIAMVEQACVFAAAGVEAELKARLARLGKQWRFVAGGKIEVYFPGKRRRDQQPCNIGLFNQDALNQVDLADML